jgi:dihydroorotate dehydrogenase
MPSQTKEVLKSDIPRAAGALKEGQQLVVSVTGSSNTAKSFNDDFVDTALLAIECGATIIEANFSCPNVSSKQGALYLCPETVFSITKQLVKAIKQVPLILKMGTFPNRPLMHQVLCNAAHAGARAVSGINTLSKKVYTAKGEPALGKKRPTSGICGALIRNHALQFVRDARSVIDSEKLDLTLIGVGGITQPEHFALFLNEGAHFVQTATGMMNNPYLANAYHRRYQDASKSAYTTTSRY